MNKKALVVIPTYNEKENIAELLESIRGLSPGCGFDVLVVDSNSPDGTGEYLEKAKSNFPGLHVLHQSRKMGLGRAYLDGFRFVQENMPDAYGAIITMDADFSHHPRYLPAMLGRLDKVDLVVGSRYVSGGRLENWPQRRKWLSRFANFYAKVLTGSPINDLTSGFHCFKAPVLFQILRHKISAEGYAFLMELKYFAASDGFVIEEIPIVFADRTKGNSKISKRVILESALIAWKIFFQRLLNRR